MPLAKPVGADANDGFAVLKKDSSALNPIRIGLATTASFALVAGATAQERYPAGELVNARLLLDTLHNGLTVLQAAN